MEESISVDGVEVQIPAHSVEAAEFISQRGWVEIIKSINRQNEIKQMGENDEELVVKKFRRAGKRMMQLSKGMQYKNAKTLMIMHWLEATDHKHRYGTNLNKYFEQWEVSDTKQNFFYWLDHGEGKDLDLPEHSRENLNNQCVVYLGQEQRKDYIVEIKDGKFYYQMSGIMLNTVKPHSEDGKESEDDKHIFVVDPQHNMYVGPKIRGKFHHSSFLAGGAVIGAGNLVIEQGVIYLFSKYLKSLKKELRSIKPHSGHYQPSVEEFHNLILLLKSKGVDMDNVNVGKIKNNNKRAMNEARGQMKIIHTISSQLDEDHDQDENRDNQPDNGSNQLDPVQEIENQIKKLQGKLTRQKQKRQASLIKQNELEQELIQSKQQTVKSSILIGGLCFFAGLLANNIIKRYKK